MKGLKPAALLALLLLASATATAEQTRFQVVPFGGLRLGGGFEDAASGLKLVWKRA